MKFHVLGLGSLALLLALVGCGGSGGAPGSSSDSAAWIANNCSLSTGSGTITYQTTWGGSVPANASQVVQVMSSPGVSIRSDTMNRGASLTDSIDFSSVPAGVYELKVQLFSAPNAGGTLLGNAHVMADICSNTNATVSTNTSQTGTSIKPYPADAKIPAGRSVRYVPVIVNVNGQAVFTPSATVNWTVPGGKGTISAGGIFVGNTVGMDTVQADIPADTLSGSTGVEILSPNVTHSKWTVLVYINAANDLFFASDLNVNQLEKVASNPDVRYVVQWKQSQDVFPASSFDGVRRYLVKQDTTNQIASDLVQNDLRDNSNNALDMGSTQTLSDFITWGKANYPADHYCLVLWNHGNGWRRAKDDAPETRAFSYDDQYGTSIQIWNMDQALGTEHFDIIAWDCSLMQMMEVAYELRNNADYVVGSEESPPANGYPYDAVFGPFAANPDNTPASLSKSFVDAMIGHAPYNGFKITQSVIQTNMLPQVATAVDALALQLISNAPALTTILPNVRTNAQAYSQNSTRYYRDLYDVCLKLEAAGGTPLSVSIASANVRTAISQAVIWEGHNNNSLNSHGLAIDFSPGSVFVSGATDYANLKFAQDTNYNEFLTSAP